MSSRDTVTNYFDCCCMDVESKRMSKFKKKVQMQLTIKHLDLNLGDYLSDISMDNGAP